MTHLSLIEFPKEKFGLHVLYICVNIKYAYMSTYVVYIHLSAHLLIPLGLLMHQLAFAITRIHHHRGMNKPFRLRWSLRPHCMSLILDSYCAYITVHMFLLCGK